MSTSEVCLSCFWNILVCFCTNNMMNSFCDFHSLLIHLFNIWLQSISFLLFAQRADASVIWPSTCLDSQPVTRSLLKESAARIDSLESQSPLIYFRLLMQCAAISMTKLWIWEIGRERGGGGFSTGLWDSFWNSLGSCLIIMNGASGSIQK